MPTKSPRIPSYRLHKSTGLGVVRLDGRDHYLGEHGTPASHEAYRRIIAEWTSSGIASANMSSRSRPSPGGSVLTVGELLLAFMTRHAETHYRRADGTPTDEIENFRQSLRPLRKLYGLTPAKDFGPLALKAVRNDMIEAELCRNECNKRVGRIKRVFGWAVENELVPPSLAHGLKAVQGLQRGRSNARESEPIKPVPDAHIEAVIDHVGSRIAAMVRLQLATGMRPGEVTVLRTSDIDMAGETWVYKAAAHKMAYRGRERTIYFGPTAQEAVKPWLRTDVNSYLFSPAEADAEFRAEQRVNRKSPVQPSQRHRKKSRPERKPGKRWTTHAYAVAIRRACVKAGVPHWHPNQLRHNAATRIRKEFGLDVARTVLGHTSPATTQIYAEADTAKAALAMKQIG
jgi:integrase